MPASDLPDARSHIHKAVVPAAGLGTRLRPLTYAYPKELLPIGRMPVLGHIAAELQAADIHDVLFIVSEQKPQIRSFFGDFYRDETLAGSGFNCGYAVQEQQRGLGDALLKAEEWAAGEAFAVAFGDCLMDGQDPAVPLRKVISTYVSNRAAATVLCERVAWETVSRYGVLDPAHAVEISGTQTRPFLVKHVVEKPARSEAPSNFVVAARWVLDVRIFQYLKRAVYDSRDELNLTDAVENMIADGGALWATPLQSGYSRRDIGSFDTFYGAFIRAALRDPECGALARRVAKEELDKLDALKPP